MQTLKIKSSKNNWTNFELIWFILSVGLILSLNIFWGSTIISTLSGLAGIISVLLCAKGKISYLYFGIFQCVTYGYIAYSEYQLYGEAMLNLLVFFPFNIVTIFIWKRNLKNQMEIVSGEEIKTRKLSKKQYAIIIPIIFVSILIYAVILEVIGARQVQLDSVAVILSIFAQILLTLRYVENWIIWIIVNAITVLVWIFTLIETGGNDYGFLAMQLAFLFSSIYAYWNWIKFTKG